MMLFTEAYMSFQLAVNGALCVSSLLAWLYLALVWQQAEGNSTIKLPVTKDDETLATAALDEDIPTDVGQWQKGNLYRKIPCTLIAGVVAVVSALDSISIGTSWTRLLAAAFWCNITTLCVVWLRQTQVHNHWRTTGVLSLLTLLATCTTFWLAIYSDQLQVLEGTMQILTFVAPLTIFSLTLSIHRSPPLITRSPFTYQDTNGFEKTSYQESASLFSVLTFGWAIHLIRSVRQQACDGVQDHSVPYLHASNRSYRLYHDWKASCAASLKGQEPANAKEEALGRSPCRVNAVLWRILQTHKSEFLITWFLDFLLAVWRMAPAWALKVFLAELAAIESKATMKYAWSWLVILVMSLVIRSIITAIDWFQWSGRLHTRIRSQVGSLVFEKLLCQRTQSTEVRSPDEENCSKPEQANSFNLFTSDTEGCATSLTVLSQLFWFFPLDLLFCAILLFNNLGSAAIFGLLTPVCLIPVSQHLTRVVSATQKDLSRASDARVAVANEVLASIKHIKLTAHESAYTEKIMAARKLEIDAMKRNQHARSWLDAMSVLGPAFTLFVSLLWYTKVQHRTVTAAVAFPSIMITGQLRQTLASIYNSVGTWLQVLNNLQRMERFLSQDVQVVGQATEFLPYPLTLQAATYCGAAGGNIVLDAAEFEWPSRALADRNNEHSRGFGLRGLSVTFERGINLICGNVASGKTMLLLGLLGEIPLVSGNMVSPCSLSNTVPLRKEDMQLDLNSWLVPSCAYVSQAPWLLNGTVFDNILFGLPFHDDRLNQVVFACCLEPDLAILPNGIYTEIGERGVILSGGQKQRVALARAMYSRAIYLFLDDVLSAVDMHTAQHILEHCLTGPIAHNRFMILVSHHASLCAPAAVQVVHLDTGCATFVGNGADYLKSEYYIVEKTESLAVDDPADEFDRTPSSGVTSAKARLSSAHKTANSVRPEKDSQMLLIQPENRGEGNAGLALWLYWAKGNGRFLFWIAACSAMIANKAIWMIRDSIVGRWTEALKSTPDQVADIDTYYLTIIGVLSILTLPAVSLRPFILFYGSRRLSQRIYKSMLLAVLRAPMRFFDTILVGTILNRFGGDIRVADIEMPDVIRMLGNTIVGLAVIAVTLLLMSPYFVIPMTVMALIYRGFGSIYLTAARELRRSEVIARSPLNSLYAEAISGSQIIRAFGSTTRFLLMQFQRSDRVQAFDNHTWSANRWLSVRFELTSILLVTSVGCAGLIMGQQSIPVGFTGFLLSSTIGAYQEAMYLMRVWTKAEVALVSIGRVKEFSDLESEAANFTNEPLPSSWPSGGKVVMDHVSARYAPDLPKSLDDICFTVNAGEKVAVVGATGSGKSTLSLTLLRIIEACEGRIHIDDVDVSRIGLHDLRSRVTIVPQDPTILSGTLRTALDPLEEGLSDQAMYAALRAVHLLRDDELVGSTTELDKDTPFSNLDAPVSEHGKNFSSGERQLICLARAILKRHKLVILDEATSSVDHETDQLITQTIEAEFKGVTMLTIAHRLRTIINYDKVIVMSAGRLVEEGSPVHLMRDPDSHFYALSRAAGEQEFDTLWTLCSKSQNMALPSTE